MTAFMFDNSADVVAWVAQKVGKPFGSHPQAIGILASDGTLIGGLVFTDYHGDGIELSLAGAAAMRRSSWATIIAYVFDQLGCARLQFHTQRRGGRNYKRLRRQIVRAGFNCEGIARRFYGKEDGVTYSLTIDDLPAFRARWGLK